VVRPDLFGDEVEPAGFHPIFEGEDENPQGFCFGSADGDNGKYTTNTNEYQSSIMKNGVK